MSLQSQLLTHLQLRAELEAMARRDLLGPSGEPKKEANEPAVRGRYP